MPSPYTNPHHLTPSPVLFPEQGLTDPHTMVIGDRLYLICGHDASPTNENWVMDCWQIQSTADLRSWRHECTIRPEDTAMTWRTRCYGSDLIAREGRFYAFVSDGFDGVFVLRAEQPSGPYQDVLGRHLIDRSMVDTQPYDPEVFADEDGTCYLVCGCGRYYIARLTDDMMALAEAPRPVVFDKAPDLSDKPCMFKRGRTYVLAWGGHYAVSNSVYGPYVRIGTFPNTHANVCSWRGRDLLFVETKDLGLFYRGCAYLDLPWNADGLPAWPKDAPIEVDPPSRIWDFTRSAMGWTATGATSVAWSPSSIGGPVGGPAAIVSMLFPLANLDQCKRVRISLRNRTAAKEARLEFCVRTEEPCWFFQPQSTFAPEDTISFPIVPHDDSYREYILDLSQHPGWHLDLKRLRLVPAVGATAGSWSISRIEVLP